MTNRKSRVFGDALSPDERTSYQVYEVTDIHGVECEGCEKQMGPGELFTRQMFEGGGPRRYPFCRECRPFVFGDTLGRDGLGPHVYF